MDLSSVTGLLCVVNIELCVPYIARDNWKIGDFVAVKTSELVSLIQPPRYSSQFYPFPTWK